MTGRAGGIIPGQVRNPPADGWRVVSQTKKKRPSGRFAI